MLHNQALDRATRIRQFSPLRRILLQPHAQLRVFPIQAQLHSQSVTIAVGLVVDLVAAEASEIVFEDLDNTLLAGAPPQHSLVLLAVLLQLLIL